VLTIAPILAGLLSAFISYFAFNAPYLQYWAVHLVVIIPLLTGYLTGTAVLVLGAGGPVASQLRHTHVLAGVAAACIGSLVILTDLVRTDIAYPDASLLVRMGYHLIVASAAGALGALVVRHPRYLLYSALLGLAIAGLMLLPLPTFARLVISAAAAPYLMGHLAVWRMETRFCDRLAAYALAAATGALGGALAGLLISMAVHQAECGGWLLGACPPILVAQAMGFVGMGGAYAYLVYPVITALFSLLGGHRALVYRRLMDEQHAAQKAV
jgi:hypothetical protein